MQDPTAPEIQETLRQMMAAHRRQWLDDRIPALGNLTPREAAVSSDGRMRLEALLAEYQWHSERQPAHMRADVQSLRRQLGLQS